MCLKFLLEGNEGNQVVVRGLEARGVRGDGGGGAVEGEGV